MAKKKAEDMRDQLKNLIMFTRGPAAWDELLKTEADIRKKRQKMIYDQQEYRRKVIEFTVWGLVILLIVGFLGFLFYLYLTTRGYI